MCLCILIHLMRPILKKPMRVGLRGALCFIKAGLNISLSRRKMPQWTGIVKFKTG
jgi:hypothetical protein